MALYSQLGAAFVFTFAWSPWSQIGWSLDGLIHVKVLTQKLEALTHTHFQILLTFSAFGLIANCPPLCVCVCVLGGGWDIVVLVIFPLFIYWLPIRIFRRGWKYPFKLQERGEHPLECENWEVCGWLFGRWEGSLFIDCYCCVCEGWGYGPLCWCVVSMYKHNSQNRKTLIYYSFTTLLANFSNDIT